MIKTDSHMEGQREILDWVDVGIVVVVAIVVVEALMHIDHQAPEAGDYSHAVDRIVVVAACAVGGLPSGGQLHVGAAHCLHLSACCLVALDCPSNSESRLLASSLHHSLHPDCSDSSS